MLLLQFCYLCLSHLCILSPSLYSRAIEFCRAGLYRCLLLTQLWFLLSVSTRVGGCRSQLPQSFRISMGTAAACFRGSIGVHMYSPIRHGSESPSRFWK